MLGNESGQLADRDPPPGSEKWEVSRPLGPVDIGRRRLPIARLPIWACSLAA